MDGPDTDTDPFNEPPRAWYLHELFAGNDPGAKVILLDALVGWDVASQQEMSEILPTVLAGYPGCLRIAVTVSKDASLDPVTLDWLKTGWGLAYGVDVPTLADPDFLMEPYLPVPDAFPTHLLIDAQSMTILQVTSGAYASVGELQTMLDYYCNQ